jgi:hypothetical protein
LRPFVGDAANLFLKDFVARFELISLFLHENVQTEAVSIQNEQTDANRGHFYSENVR